MENEELKTVVNHAVSETIRQLKKDGYISGSDADYRRGGDLLKRYYKGGVLPDGIRQADAARAIASVRSDAFYELLPLYYGDGATIEKLAEYFRCDVTTVSRNKKRLVIEIAKLL